MFGWWIYFLKISADISIALVLSRWIFFSANWFSRISHFSSGYDHIHLFNILCLICTFQFLFLWLKWRVNSLISPLVYLCLDLRWLDWIFWGWYLPTLSMNYVGMIKDIKYNQFSPQILCLRVSVLISHWHCFQVSYARAHLAKR